jgi:hypothetical protein
MAPLGSFSNQWNLLLLIKSNSSYLTSNLSNKRAFWWLFIIVLNNKEPYFIMGLLLFFISNDNLFFKFLKDGSLDYLVVIFEELTTCVAIECNICWYLEKWFWIIEVGTHTHYSSKIISHNTVLPQIISFLIKTMCIL